MTKTFKEIHTEEMTRINAIRNSIKSEINPDNLSDFVLQLSSWKGWLGEKMVEAKMDYNRHLNELRIKYKMSASVAKIKGESTSQYMDKLFLEQIYKDCQGLISAGKVKLNVMKDDRWG